MYHCTTGDLFQNLHNIYRNIWTNKEDCGKICIGEQPGFYTMAAGGFDPVRGDEYGYF